MEELSVSSPSPVENGHTSCDSNLKPEAEQSPNENDPDTVECSSSNTPTEDETHLEEPSENNEVECSHCQAEHFERSPEGIRDEQNETTEHELHAESAENRTNESEETECCEGMMAQ